jgi:hypothetical protein
VHRFKRVEMRLEPVSLPPGLDLKAALAAGRDQFRSHRQGADEFVLELSCEPALAALLEEAPLGADQVVEPPVQGVPRLRVTVRDSWELRWWLMGRADQVEVLSPDWLRREIGTALRKASARYQRNTGHDQVG